MTNARLRPLFPDVASGAGHYESIYFVANHPTDAVALWIRYTVHKPLNGAATGSIWFTLFEPDGPTAVKVTADAPRSHAADLLAVDALGSVRADGATGDVGDAATNASWDVHFEPVDDELRHLPHAWMYRSAVPRTKSTSPYPAMLVSGTVTVDGRTFTLDHWPGMLGHNWGTEHAHRWIWLRGASFADRPHAWLDVVIGRVKIGPVVLPWIANGVFAPDGRDSERLRVGGLGHRVSVSERSDGCDLVIPGREISLDVRVTAPLATSVRWEYADPTGGPHTVRNCSIAGVELQVRRRGTAEVQRLSTAHGGVYELGTPAV